MLSRHLEQLHATATSGGCGPTPPPPPPAPFPALPGNTSCGFVPPMATLQHATVCLMADCSDEVREGDRVSVTAIGSIDQSGCFSVKILPDRDGLQDIICYKIPQTLWSELYTYQWFWRQDFFFLFCLFHVSKQALGSLISFPLSFVSPQIMSTCIMLLYVYARAYIHMCNTQNFHCWKFMVLCEVTKNV